MAKTLTLEELNGLTRTAFDNIGTHEAMSVTEKIALWQRVVATSQDTNVLDKHLTATCNALCFLTRANSTDSRAEVRTVAYCSETWQHLLTSSTRAFTNGKSKPALQILETMVSLAREEPNREGLVDDIETSLRAMMELLSRPESSGRHKEASIFICLFLRKLINLFSFVDLVTHVFGEKQNLLHANPVDALQCTTDPQARALCSFIVSLLIALGLADSKSAILKLLTHITTNHQLFPGIDVVLVTNLAIRAFSTSRISHFQQTLKDALPAILTKQVDFNTFLETSIRNSNSIEATSVTLAVMLYGRSKQYISHEDTIMYTEMHTTDHRPTTHSVGHEYPGYVSLLTSCEPTLRLQALRLLTFHTSPKEAMARELVATLSAVLPVLHDDTDAFQRGELVSIFRNILTRLQQSYVILSRNAQPQMQHHLQEEYKTFSLQYHQFLLAELATSVSYTRHTLALQMLALVLDPEERNKAKDVLFVQDSMTFDSLTTLLTDAFDDVRALCTRLLRRFACSDPQLFGKLWTNGQIMTKVSLLAAKTNRADHADALGRAVMLDAYANQIQNTGRTNCLLADQVIPAAHELNCAISELNELVTSNHWPLHGLLLGLAYTISELSDRDHLLHVGALLNSISSISDRIWFFVQPHLCIDSPEMEGEEIEDGMHAGPKDLLAYAWRALRDTNVLMQALLRPTTASIDAIVYIGTICFEQLARLRHRGAFSTVAQTFLLCCDRAREIQLRGSLNHWFEKALLELELQADKLTRRSAGLPAMFSAIINPDNNEEFLSAINRLLDIASSEVIKSADEAKQTLVRLPQVHALNCLKEIMVNSRFRGRTDAIVLKIIAVACQKMTSDIWAIKNCGLMLLRACITRLELRLSSESPSSVKSSHSAHYTQEPIETALGLLFSHDQEAVFAGLDILSRLDTNYREDQRVIESVQHCLGHELWHIRAQTARLLISRFEPGKAMSYVRGLFSDMPARCRLNQLHGHLLLLNNVVTSFPQSITAVATAKHDLICLLLDLLQNTVLVVQEPLCSLWLEIVLSALRLKIISTNEFLLLMYQFKPTEHISSASGYALFQLQLTRAMALTEIFDETKGSRATIILEEGQADFILTELQDFITANEASKAASFATTHLSTEFSEHTRCAAIKLLTLCLKFHHRSLDRSAIEHSLTAITFDVNVGRELFGAQLVLLAGICVCLSQSTGENSFFGMNSHISGFATRLRLAATDEIDLDSRFAALRALEQFKDRSCVHDIIDGIFEQGQKIDILCILYDLLNDDDEEIRVRASHIAKHFYDPRLCESSSVLTHSPMVSRGKLIGYMLMQAGGHNVLYDQAVRRILGVQAKSNTNGASISTFCTTHTVERVMEEVYASMNDLFAEEKQNLYVDDIAEVHVWARVAAAVESDQSEALKTILQTWTKDGLRYISSLLADSRDHAVTRANNWIFDSVEALTVVVRVVVLSRILTMDIAAREMEVQLESMQRECRLQSAPIVVLKSFTWSLQ